MGWAREHHEAGVGSWLYDCDAYRVPFRISNSRFTALERSVELYILKIRIRPSEILMIVLVVLHQNDLDTRSELSHQIIPLLSFSLVESIERDCAKRTLNISPRWTGSAVLSPACPASIVSQESKIKHSLPISFENDSHKFQT
jgi:hypothetical protein